MSLVLSKYVFRFECLKTTEELCWRNEEYTKVSVTICPPGNTYFVENSKLQPNTGISVPVPTCSSLMAGRCVWGLATFPKLPNPIPIFSVWPCLIGAWIGRDARHLLRFRWGLCWVLLTQEKWLKSQSVETEPWPSSWSPGLGVCSDSWTTVPHLVTYSFLASGLYKILGHNGLLGKRKSQFPNFPWHTLFPHVCVMGDLLWKAAKT